MHVTIAIHYPRAEHADAFLRFMRKVAAAMEGTPGLLSIDALREPGGSRLVAVGRWESREAFEAAVPRLIGIEGRDPAWSARPDDLLRLDG